QDAGGETSLTFTRYPYNFSNDRPLKPDSPVLLYFNASVRPDSVEGGIRLYDKTNERFAAVTSTRPTPDQILEFRRNAPEEKDLDRFVLIRPTSPLRLGGTCYLHAAHRLASPDGTHELVQGQLAYLGKLMTFAIRDIQASSPYDAERELVI